MRGHYVAACVLLIAVGLRVASGPTGNLSYVLLAAYAFGGRLQVIQSLSISWLLNMLSPGIVPDASLATIGRYLVFFSSFLSLFLRWLSSREKKRVGWMVLYTILLGSVVSIHSVVFSRVVDVSILKILSWVLVMGTVFSAWEGLRGVERDLASKQLYYLLLLILLASIPTLFLPLGYLRNGTGFQGVLNHPQGFGPTLALFGVWVGARLFGMEKSSWWQFGLFFLCLFLIVLSEARTAGVSLVVGLGFSALCTALIAKKSLKKLLPGLFVTRFYAVVLVCVLGGGMAGSLLSERIFDYLMKRGDGENISEAYEASRGGLMDVMVSNIEQEPFFGIGFGIGSSAETMVVERDPWFGLPISALVEKGVLPLAVLEELGFLGSVAVAAWVFLLLRRSAKAGVEPLAVVLTVFLLNMGECTFFSPGGLGLLSLIFIGWAYSEAGGHGR